MADSGKKKGGGGKEVRGNLNESGNSNSSSTMEVDPPAITKGTEGEDESEHVDVESPQKKEAQDEDEFLVVEEDDGEDDGNENSVKTNESFTTPEPMDAAASLPDDKVKKKTDEDLAGGEGEKVDDEVLLVNPLFGKRTAPPPPVIDIESSENSSDDDESEEDFSVDVSVDNFQKQQLKQEKDDSTTNVDLTTDGEGDSGLQEQRANPSNGQSCNDGCYHEKGILVNEIERLRKAVYELSERHSVLEDFIEVEYSDRFDKFLKNREHLVSMGFGGKESEGNEDVIDGKRSSKSVELIELLKMIKEQSSEKEEGPSVQKPGTTLSKSFKGGHSGGGGGGNKKQQQNQKGKPIPSISSANREPVGGGRRGGALNYDQRPVLVPNVVHAQQALNFQYQQQLLAQQQKQMHYESMCGGRPGGRDSRDFVTAVGRTELYPSSGAGGASYGYGGNNRSEGLSKESKKQRKRKRQSEVSSEASSSAANAKGSQQGVSGGSGGGAASKIKDFADDDDIEVIDYNEQALNPIAKRICPLCQKIVNRKGLRDHLSIVHQGHKVACPVCQVEFMQRRKIKTHMRDSHDLPVSEYSAYIEKIYKDIEEQCGVWLDKLMKEAETPTKDQLLVHNAEIQLNVLKKRQEKLDVEGGDGMRQREEPVKNLSGSGSGGNNRSRGAPLPPPLMSSTSRGSQSFGGGGGQGGGRRRDDRDRGSSMGGGSGGGGVSSARHAYEQPVRYFTGANTKVSVSSGKSQIRPGQGSEELYGPGGYAQYAAKYLQQRAGSSGGGSSVGMGVSRLYTPF